MESNKILNINIVCFAGLEGALARKSEIIVCVDVNANSMTATRANSFTDHDGWDILVTFII